MFDFGFKRKRNQSVYLIVKYSNDVVAVADRVAKHEEILFAAKSVFDRE